MIAVKNLQYLNALLMQEEMLRAIAGLYINTSNPEVKTMLENIIKTSEKNSTELLAYLSSH